jgi:hypothetical protein
MGVIIIMAIIQYIGSSSVFENAGVERSTTKWGRGDINRRKEFSGGDNPWH